MIDFHLHSCFNLHTDLCHIPKMTYARKISKMQLQNVFPTSFLIFNLPLSCYQSSSQYEGSYFQFKLLLSTNANGTDNHFLHHSLSPTPIKHVITKELALTALI